MYVLGNSCTGCFCFRDGNSNSISFSGDVNPELWPFAPNNIIVMLIKNVSRMWIICNIRTLFSSCESFTTILAVSSSFVRPSHRGATTPAICYMITANANLWTRDIITAISLSMAPFQLRTNNIHLNYKSNNLFVGAPCLWTTYKSTNHPLHLLFDPINIPQFIASLHSDKDQNHLLNQLVHRILPRAFPMCCRRNSTLKWRSRSRGKIANSSLIEFWRGSYVAGRNEQGMHAALGDCLWFD